MFGRILAGLRVVWRVVRFDIKNLIFLLIGDLRDLGFVGRRVTEWCLEGNGTISVGELLHYKMGKILNWRVEGDKKLDASGMDNWMVSFLKMERLEDGKDSESGVDLL